MFYGMLGVVLGGRIGYVLFYAFGETACRSAAAAARSRRAA
jgi:prolipoprotein diacylglyceryltransferase